MSFQKYLSSLIALVIIVASCKKQDVQQTVDPENCVTGSSISSGNIIEGRYIVALKSTSGTARSMSTQRVVDESSQLLSRNAISRTAIENTFPGEPGGFIVNLSSAEAERLRTDEAVEAIEPDRTITLSTCFTVVEPRLVTWNIHRVGYGNGIGKRAWIIDTGIDFDHPDLTVDQAMSRSFVSGTPSADDENGHGTHVAGIIGGKNNAFGVLGVASGATLISLRVMNKDGQGVLSSIIQALGYINTSASAGDVVNMSLGDDEGISGILDEQVRNTASRGIYIAIAAGNDHVMASGFSPGRVNASTVFTVSAVDSLDNFASFSNYGNDAVDYAAPGVRILSTFFDGRYAYMSGTSMAAPHVAGLLLLKGSAITSSGTARNDPDGVADPIAHY
jgi:subtilisin family serine protease